MQTQTLLILHIFIDKMMMAVMMMIVKGDDCDDILMIVKTWKMMMTLMMMVMMIIKNIADPCAVVDLQVVSDVSTSATCIHFLLV
jgi:hypothetical protein